MATAPGKAPAKAAAKKAVPTVTLKHIAASLEDAVAALKRDPQRPVLARVDNLDVELRVVEASPPPGIGLGDRMAAAGPWQGETEEEILELLREARRAGSSEDPPPMP